MQRKHGVLYMMLILVLMIPGCFDLIPLEEPTAGEGEEQTGAAADYEELVLELLSPASDVTVALGATVQVRWRMSELPDDPTVDILYRLTDEETEHVIVSGLPTERQGTFALDTSTLQLGLRHYIIVRLRSAGEEVRTATSGGSILVANSQIDVTAPQFDVVILPTDTVNVTWQGSYVPVGANLEVVLDLDLNYSNGNEKVIHSEVLTSGGATESGKVVLNGIDLWNRSDVTRGLFYSIGIRVVKGTTLYCADYASGAVKLYDGEGFEVTHPVTDLTVGSGDEFLVGWLTTGLPDGLTIRAVFVDQASGAEVVGASGLDAADGTALLATAGLATEHTYKVILELRDGETVIMTGTAPGKITISTEGSLIYLTTEALISPGQKVHVGLDMTTRIEWGVNDPPDGSKVKLYLDEDGDFDTTDDQIEITPAAGIEPLVLRYDFTPDVATYAAYTGTDFYVFANVVGSDESLVGRTRSVGKLRIGEGGVIITVPNTVVTVAAGEDVTVEWQMVGDICARVTSVDKILRLYLDTTGQYRASQSIEVTDTDGIDPCAGTTEYTFALDGVQAGRSYYVVARLFLEGETEEESVAVSTGTYTIPSNAFQLLSPESDVTTGLESIAVSWSTTGVDTTDRDVRVLAVGVAGQKTGSSLVISEDFDAVDGEGVVDASTLPPGTYIVRGQLFERNAQNDIVELFTDDASGRIIVPGGYNGVYDLADAEAVVEKDYSPIDCVVFEGWNISDGAGYELAGVGDIDVDGLTDFLIFSRYGQEYSGGKSGSAYLIYGNSILGQLDVPVVSLNTIPSLLNPEPDIEGTLLLMPMENLASDDGTGTISGDYCALGLPDVSGDGFGDLIIGCRDAAPLLITYSNETEDPVDVPSDQFGMARTYNKDIWTTEPMHVYPWFRVTYRYDDWTTDADGVITGSQQKYIDIPDVLALGIDYLPGDEIVFHFVEETTVSPSELDLSLSNITGNATLGTPAQSHVDFDDTAGQVLQFSNATYTVNEDGGAVTITVTRVGGTAGSAWVSYATSDGTATAGSDYTAVSGTASFSDGEGTKTFNIPIIDDSTVESNETINLTLSNPSGNVTLGSLSTAVVTIVENDDSGQLQLLSGVVSANEDATEVVVTVSRTGGTAGTVTVDYATSDGTATAPGDYTATSGTLTFTNGQATQTFAVPLVNDGDTEGDETVSLTLSNPGGGASLGTPATGTLIIVDDETAVAGRLRFGDATYNVFEDEVTATITVVRVGGSTGAVTVDYTTSNGTATANSDYTASTGTLTFADGQTMLTFDVAVTDDAAVEGDETIGLTLSNATGGATLGDPPSALLTIVDDDVAEANEVQFSSDTYTAAPGTELLITVTSTSPADGDITVHWMATATVVDPNTGAVTIVTYGEGDVTIPDGESLVTFTITLPPTRKRTVTSIDRNVIGPRGAYYLLTSDRLTEYRNNIYDLNMIGSPVDDGASDSAGSVPSLSGLWRWSQGLPERTMMVTSEYTGTAFGADLSVLPDMDGDGTPQLLVGLPDAGVRDISNPGEGTRAAAGAVWMTDSQLRVTSIATQVGRMAWTWTWAWGPDQFIWGNPTGEGMDPPEHIVGDPTSVLILGPSANAGLSQVAGLGRFNSPADYSTYTSGDFEGDGIPDMVVAAPAMGSDAGTVYVVFGRSAFGYRAAVLDLAQFNEDIVPPTAPDMQVPVLGLKITGDTPGDHLGEVLKPAGDFNGDGLADFMIGVPRATNEAGEANAGRVIIIFGQDGAMGDYTIDEFNGSKEAKLPALIFEGAAAGDAFGTRICNVYDVNGDGYDDILVAAPNADATGKENCGKVYLIYGRGNIVRTDSLTGATYVDYDGDNLPDAWDDDDDGSIDRYAFSAEKIGTDLVGATFVGAHAGDQLQAVSLAGDTSGDGISDFLLGAPYADVYPAGTFDDIPDGNDNAGKAYLIFGRSLTVGSAGGGE